MKIQGSNIVVERKDLNMVAFFDSVYKQIHMLNDLGIIHQYQQILMPKVAAIFGIPVVYIFQEDLIAEDKSDNNVAIISFGGTAITRQQGDSITNCNIVSLGGLDDISLDRIVEAMAWAYTPHDVSEEDYTLAKKEIKKRLLQ